MGFDRKNIVCAMSYIVVGMGLGVYMAATQSHGQHVTHAHLLLVGFVTSLAYGVIHKLWLDASRRTLAWVQFIAHHAGAVGMCTGLFLLYGGFVQAERLEPLLGAASMGILLGAAAMLFMVLSSRSVRT